MFRRSEKSERKAPAIYRASLATLHAVGADVYDETGSLIMTEERDRPPASHEPAAAAAYEAVEGGRPQRWSRAISGSFACH